MNSGSFTISLWVYKIGSSNMFDGSTDGTSLDTTISYSYSVLKNYGLTS